MKPARPGRTMKNHEQVTSNEAAAIALQERAALWSTGELRASDVVDAACDALIAGIDTPGLRILAACTRAEADYHVQDLLPAALDELGLTFYPVASAASQKSRRPSPRSPHARRRTHFSGVHLPDSPAPWT